MQVEVHFEKGSVGAMHSHPDSQLTYVLEGEFEFTIGGEKKIVRKGDTLYKIPGHPTWSWSNDKILFASDKGNEPGVSNLYIIDM